MIVGNIGLLRSEPSQPFLPLLWFACNLNWTLMSIFRFLLLVLLLQCLFNRLVQLDSPLFFLPPCNLGLIPRIASSQSRFFPQLPFGLFCILELLDDSCISNEFFLFGSCGGFVEGERFESEIGDGEESERVEDEELSRFFRALANLEFGSVSYYMINQ